MKNLILCLLVAAQGAAAAPALADGAAIDPAEAYRAVIAAQLAARKPPTPARPDEAETIYGNYLKSLGHASPSPSQTDEDKSSETAR